MKAQIKMINRLVQIYANAALKDVRASRNESKYPNIESYEEFIFRVNSKTKITYDSIIRKEEFAKLQPDAKQLLTMIYSKFIIETSTTYSTEFDKMIEAKRGESMSTKMTIIASLVSERYGEDKSVVVFMHDFIAANKILIKKYPTLLAAKDDEFDLEISKALLNCSNEYTNICKELANMFFKSLGKNTANYFWESDKGTKTIPVQHFRGIFAAHDFIAFFVAKNNAFLISANVNIICRNTLMVLLLF